MSSLRKGWTDKSDKSTKMELGCARERAEKVYLHFAGAGMSSQTSCILRGVLEHEWKEWGRNEKGGVGWGVEGGLPDQRSSLIPQTRSCKCSREVKPQIWHPKPWGEIYLVCELLQQDHKHKNGNDVNMCKHGLGSQTKPKLERFCQVYEMSTSSSLSALLNLFENTRWKSSPAYNCKAVHGDCSRQKEVTASVCGRL